MTELDSELAAAGEEFRREIQTAFAGLTVLDDTPILRIHSAAYCEDGETFSVYIDMPGGITRIYRFTPGRPVSITDHE